MSSHNDEQDALKRRLIRKNLRYILEETLNTKELLEDLDNDEQFYLIREKMNITEQSVEHVREMQLDALVFKELVTAVHQQGMKLQDYSKQLNITNLINCLSYKYNSMNTMDDCVNDGEFPWAMLGRDVGVLFRSVPSVETMYGPIFREVKARKQTERKARNAESSSPKATKAAEVIHDNDDETEEASKRRQLALYTTMLNKSEEIRQSQTQSYTQTKNPEGSIDLLNLIVDPESVVQTVENLFDFSFIIKKKHAIIAEDKDDLGLPIIIPSDERAFASVPQKQRVFSLSIKEVKKMMKIINRLKSIDSENPQSLLPNSFSQLPSTQSASQGSSSNTQGGFGSILHRESELYAAKSVWDQTKIIQRNNARKIDTATGVKRKGDTRTTNIDDNDSDDDQDIVITKNNSSVKKTKREMQ